MLPETESRGSSVDRLELSNSSFLGSNSAPVAAVAAASSCGVALATRKDRLAPVIDVLGPPLDAKNRLRPGWTEGMVREVAEGKFALHLMSMFDGIAPSRKEFQLVVPHERVYRRYYGSYSRFVESSGYKPSVARQTVEAAARRRAAWDAEKKAKALARRTGRGGASKREDVVEVRAAAPVQVPDAPEEKSKRETVYGARLEGCGMVYAPTNEQGVVLLFGMMAKELGFEVEMVRTGYPDCEAKRMGADGKLRKVRIEFEFVSSRFDHDPEECDLIVCWEDDANPTGLEVLELKKEVGRK